MENKKPKSLQIFGICLIVVAAILTGVFLGAWTVSYDYNSYNSCSADVGSVSITSSSHNVALPVFAVCPNNNSYNTNYSTEFFIFKTHLNEYSLNLHLFNYNYVYSNINAPQYILSNVNQGDNVVDPSSFVINLGSSFASDSLNLVSSGSVYAYHLSTSASSPYRYTLISSSSQYSYGGSYYCFSSCSSSFGNVIGATTGNFYKDSQGFLTGWSSSFVNTSQFDSFVNSSSIGTGSWCFISLFDSNYNRISLFIRVSSSLLYDYSTFAFREIFFEYGSSDLDDIYNKGLVDGYHNGYQVGYSAGVADDNDYTFLGLMGAVVDAPVQVFTRMFDFTILGVNLKDFLLGLFGVSVTITILKFILVR